METPLWYKVTQGLFGYKEFLDRNNKLTNDGEIMSLFILICLKRKDPYVSEKHILTYFINDGFVTEKSLRYFYLYWIFMGNYGNELLISNTPIVGRMSLYNLTLPMDFNSDYISDWMTAILHYFFDIGPITCSKEKYIKGNYTHLNNILNYTRQLYDTKLAIPNKTTCNMYKLFNAHKSLIEVRNFLCGGIYPTILHPYRRDRDFVLSVIYQYWPNILKTLDNYQPFDEWEINELQKAHRELYECGDIDFLFYYIQLFNASFGYDHILSKQLWEYIKPSKENDRLHAGKFLYKLNPYERQRYIPQYFPVSDTQVGDFIKEVGLNGFEVAIRPYILRIKNQIESELISVGAELCNTTFFSTQVDIYLYSPCEYIFLPINKTYFVFLISELHHLSKEKKNPYNRDILPDYIFNNLIVYRESESLEEAWSAILRREINLKPILDTH